MEPSKRQDGLSNSVIIYNNNRISVMFDENVKKTNRLSQVELQQWTLIDDFNVKPAPIKSVSALERRKANLKSRAFEINYKVTTEKSGGLLKNFMKLISADSLQVTKESHLPVVLFHHRYAKTVRVEEIAMARMEIQDRFQSTIWSCYRKKFRPLLSNDQRGIEELNLIHRCKNLKIGQTTDSGWGCTIRVFQMLLCHSFTRHQVGEYTLAMGPIDEYINLLTLINDNGDGAECAFGIQNVVRMALVFEKLPGEWHGNKSISLVFSHLNKVYAPIKNFQICLFGDETLYYDKIVAYGFKK